MSRLHYIQITYIECYFIVCEDVKVTPLIIVYKVFQNYCTLTMVVARHFILAYFQANIPMSKGSQRSRHYVYCIETFLICNPRDFYTRATGSGLS